MKQQYYDPWAQVGQSLNDATFKYLSTRPNPQDAAYKDAQIRAIDAQIQSSKANTGKTGLENQILQNQLDASGAVGDIFKQIYGNYAPPAPSKEFVGPMPVMDSAPPEVRKQTFEQNLPALITSALRMSPDGKNLGTINRALAGAGGATPETMSNMMLGAGDSYESTPVGYGKKLESDPSGSGGATGANIRAYMDASKANGRPVSYDQAWREMYGGAVKMGGQVNPETGSYEAIPGFNKVKSDTSQYVAEGTDTGKLNVERSANYTKAESALNSFKMDSKIVNQNIDDALNLIKNSSTATGYGSYLTLGGALPGDRRELDNYLNTIKSSIGFDKLQTMRENSPTGGALGQVSDSENKLLQAVRGALDPLQEKQLVKNLGVIKGLYPTVLAEKERAFRQDYGNRQPFGGNPQASGEAIPTGGNIGTNVNANGIKFLGFE